MRGYPLLFGVDIAHDYFDDPRRCRFDFEPVPATAEWLAKADCVVRPSANALRVHYADDGVRPPRARNGKPVVLAFNVRPMDPLFGLYTDGLSPVDGIAPGSDPTLVFDSAAATQEAAGAPWRLTADERRPAKARAGNGLNVRPDFQIVIRLAADLGDAGRLYDLPLASRAVTWKYLFEAAWSQDRPMAVDATPALTADFAKADFDPAAPSAPLADGRRAIAIASREPVALAQHARRRIELWAQTEAGAKDRVLIRSLPVASPANLAFEDAEDPADAPRLVCEIFVPSRLNPSVQP